MKPALLAFLALATLQAQSPDARQQLISYLNAQAKSPLEARAKEIAAFKTKAEAEQRQAIVRETILRLPPHEFLYANKATQDLVRSKVERTPRLAPSPTPSGAPSAR